MFVQEHKGVRSIYLHVISLAVNPLLFLSYSCLWTRHSNARYV